MDLPSAVFTALFTAALGASHWYKVYGHRRVKEGLARALGMEIHADGVRGVVEGVHVHVTVNKAASEDLSRCRLELGGPKLLPGFEAFRNDAVGRLLRNDTATGDPLFDDHVLLNGQEVEVAARLDEAGRRCLSALIHCGAALRAGWILVPDVLSTPEGVRTELARLLPLVKSWVGLRPKASHAACLMTNALRDPLAAVRLRNLLLLVRHCGSEPGFEETVLKALDDEDPRVRLLAAGHAPTDEGETSPYRRALPPNDAIETLLELARGPYDASLRASAIELLATRQPPERSAAALRELTEDGAKPVREAAKRWLAGRSSQ